MGFSPLDGLKKFTLDNGLTVYLKRQEKLPIVSVQMWVRAGTLDETDRNNGVAHFLEHMLFKGTANYSVGEITRLVESQGGSMNAGTSKEFTEYYIDITREGYPEALKIIADISQNALIPEDELESERTVVLEEIKRADDNPGTILYETFNGQMYSETPYRRRVLGSAESVGAMSREDLMEFYRSLYVAENMVLVVVGDIDIDASMKLIRESFSSARKGRKNARKGLSEPVKTPTEKRVAHSVQMDYVMCGFLGPDIDSKHQYAADILSTILGSGLSARLYRRIKEEKQLAHTIEATFYTHQGSGIFMVTAMCDTEKTDRVVEEIKNELGNVLEQEIKDSEIKRAAEMTRSSWYFGQETYHGQASTVGYWALMERLDYVDTYIKNIDRVSEKSIRDFMKEHFNGLTVTVVYPES